MKTLHTRSGPKSDPLYYREVLNALEPFRTTGKLRGDKGGFSFHDLPRSGREPLEGEWEKFIGEISEHHAFAYTVWSHEMPIAWAVHSTAGVQWFIPPVKYSATTSGYQNKIRAALDVYHDLPGLTDGVDLVEFSGPVCVICKNPADYRMLASWTTSDAERRSSTQDMCAACVLTKNAEFVDSGNGTLKVVQEYA